jgi:hypothetical protein
MANWQGLDGTQTICILCYGAMVGNSEQERSNAAEKVKQPPVPTRQSRVSAQRPVQVKQRPAQAKRQSSRKVKPEQTKEKPSPPIGGKLRRQFPGLESLIAFLRAAGVSVEVVRDRYLRLDGIQTEPLSHLPQQETLEWNSVVNKIVLEYLRSKFVRAVEDNTCFGEGLRVVLRAREKGFVVMRDDVRLATIHASRAEIPHREAIHANFLVPGPHWRLLAEIVNQTESQLTAEWEREKDARTAAEAAAAAAQAERRRAANRRRIDHLPDDLAPELIDACLDASRRIRLERQVAYERPVTLEFDARELTLLPITGTATHPLLPFRLSTGAQTLNGQLVLADCDPLPLLIDADIADTEALTAWTCALVGFADATCIEFNSAAPASRSEPTRSRWHPTPVLPHRRPSLQALPRKHPWPSHLAPIGDWVRYSGSFVPGHRRRLHNGQTASDEARDRARQAGIVLHPDETWVRPHARGVPDGIEMRFLWHAPAELELSMHSRRTRERAEGGRLLAR